MLKRMWKNTITVKGNMSHCLQPVLVSMRDCLFLRIGFDIGKLRGPSSFGKCQCFVLRNILWESLMKIQDG